MACKNYINEKKNPNVGTIYFPCDGSTHSYTGTCPCTGPALLCAVISLQASKSEALLRRQRSVAEWPGEGVAWQRPRLAGWW